MRTFILERGIKIEGNAQYISHCSVEVYGDEHADRIQKSKK
jgi:hypothetical protein